MSTICSTGCYKTTASPGRGGSTDRPAPDRAPIPRASEAHLSPALTNVRCCERGEKLSSNFVPVTWPEPGSIAAEMVVSGAAEMVRIPTAPATLDKMTFDKEFRAKMPVVIKSLARAWTAFDRWEPAQLSRLVGDVLVQPFVSRDGLHFLGAADVVERREMRLAQVVERVFEGRERGATQDANGTRIYLRGALFSAVKEDIEVPQFMEDGAVKLNETLSGIWIGSKGCITPLHFDAWHGVLGQVRGTKRITLFSPADTENIYPCVSSHPCPVGSCSAPKPKVWWRRRRKQTDHGTNTVMHTSELVLEKLGKPDYMEKYPLAEELTPWVVNLEPGDAYASLPRSFGNKASQKC